MAPAGDVSGQLSPSVSNDRDAPKVLLDLDDGKTDFDIDPAVARDGRLQLCLDIVLRRAEVTSQQQLPNVSLNRGFTPNAIPVGQPIEKRLEFISCR